MQYREIKPGPAAARYIQCYWLLEDDSPDDAAQRIVPDGRPELIINFSRPFENYLRGAWHAQPECFFVGQITGPMLLRAKGPARTLGVRFHPYGAGKFLGLPVGELTNRVVRVDDISKRISRDLQYCETWIFQRSRSLCWTTLWVRLEMCCPAILVPFRAPCIDSSAPAVKLA